ncbi:hypothetical protein DPX16_7480 [Anabarilius grahami]|uniref:Uncharacterized protein n=1 Tax=Anabarilius grahami TaxID=495550 RepID=A0A3N0YL93_ANAGA|nr:hypothetical protein DPX16_7480 [Anabarilius grahami]
MVNYQKYITVMQLALGVTAINRERSLPPRKHMCYCHLLVRKGISFCAGYLAVGCRVSVWCVRPTLDPDAADVSQPCNLLLSALDLRASDWVFPKHDKDKYGPAVYYPKINAFVPTPESTSLLDESEGSAHGKPSLRRIKGRIHRSKSLDSIDLLDSNVS